MPLLLRTFALVAACAASVAAHAQPAPFRLTPTPTLTIGAEDRGPNYQLDRVFGAVRLPDGGVAIGNSGTAELRLYDAKGRFVKSASRMGAGPGEFDAISSVVPKRAGNVLLATDEMHARVNRYSVDGRTLPQLQFTSSPPAVQSILEAVAGVRLIGRVTSNATLQSAPGTRIVTRYRYGVYDSTGRQQALLFELPTRERIVHMLNGVTRYPFVPFAPEPRVTAAGDRVYLIRGADPVIEVWSTEAKQVGTLRWNADRTRVRDIWSRWRQGELDAMTRPADRQFYTDFYSDRLPLPEYVPVAEGLHVDPLGRLWVVRTKMPWEDARRVDVLDARGRFLGQVALPAGFTLFEVGRDWLLGRTRDVDGVEQVVVYGVVGR
ncbi:MAG: 6-bladed beta-propeller [Gemmatimonadetes bacterium]|nr:6-bladed beta-propeller [Gemmatimonadota bacterium]